MTKSLLSSTVALSAILLSAAVASTSFAQTPKDEMAECQKLYGQWSKYNGTSSYSKDVDADMAFEDCRKGNTGAGVAELKNVLVRNQIPMPESQTAATPGAPSSTH